MQTVHHAAPDLNTLTSGNCNKAQEQGKLKSRGLTEQVEDDVDQAINDTELKSATKAKQLFLIQETKLSQSSKGEHLSSDDPLTEKQIKARNAKKAKKNRQNASEDFTLIGRLRKARKLQLKRATKACNAKEHISSKTQDPSEVKPQTSNYTEMVLDRQNADSDNAANAQIATEINLSEKDETQNHSKNGIEATKQSTRRKSEFRTKLRSFMDAAAELDSQQQNCGTEDQIQGTQTPQIESFENTESLAEDNNSEIIKILTPVSSTLPLAITEEPNVSIPDNTILQSSTKGSSCPTATEKSHDRDSQELTETEQILNPDERLIYKFSGTISTKNPPCEVSSELQIQKSTNTVYLAGEELLAKVKNRVGLGDKESIDRSPTKKKKKDSLGNKESIDSENEEQVVLAHTQDTETERTISKSEKLLDQRLISLRSSAMEHSQHSKNSDTSAVHFETVSEARAKNSEIQNVQPSEGLIVSTQQFQSESSHDIQRVQSNNVFIVSAQQNQLETSSKCKVDSLSTSECIFDEQNQSGSSNGKIPSAGDFDKDQMSRHASLQTISVSLHTVETDSDDPLQSEAISPRKEPQKMDSTESAEPVPTENVEHISKENVEKQNTENQPSNDITVVLRGLNNTESQVSPIQSADTRNCLSDVKAVLSSEDEIKQRYEEALKAWNILVKNIKAKKDAKQEPQQKEQTACNNLLGKDWMKEIDGRKTRLDKEILTQSAPNNIPTAEMSENSGNDCQTIIPPLWKPFVKAVDSKETQSSMEAMDLDQIGENPEEDDCSVDNSIAEKVKQSQEESEWSEEFEWRDNQLHDGPPLKRRRKNTIMAYPSNIQAYSEDERTPLQSSIVDKILENSRESQRGKPAQRANQLTEKKGAPNTKEQGKEHNAKLPSDQNSKVNGMCDNSEPSKHGRACAKKLQILHSR